MSLGAPDARLSNYRIERLLGSGGMGSVYLARDLALDRDVAIKFISPEKAADASARHRLVREARAAAALEHPNICAVHEVIVEQDGRAAIVMQYVEGETLAETLRRGPLDVRFAISVATDVANALLAAHRRNIIHRDIKPQNIIITPEKQAKILDFGVARQHEVAAPEADTTTLLTTPGIIVGTPAYMSPEQAQQMSIDGRSDLFSLGAVLFECLTGKRPFTGRSSIDVLGAVLHEQPPPVSSLRPELGPEHDSLIERLLAKHPDDRFKSADELLGALRLLAGTSSRVTVHSPPRKLWPLWPRLRHSWWMRLGVGVLAVVAAVGVWSWRLPEGAPDPAAADYYRRGTDAIRDGAYQEARLALNQAIAAAPRYAPTYVRLAEAETELDDPESAQRALLKAGELVPIESRLPYEHRQRFRAVRAMLLRDVDGAIHEYEQLAKAKPQDAGVLLDLGRTQDAAGLTRQALATYDKALQIDPQYAAAHLRRGGILALEGKRAEALAEFAIAERLYRAASNAEGEIEALIRRGRALSQGSDVPGARQALERARELAGNLQSRAQEIRARLVLASLVSFEGRYEEAAVQMRAAIDDALRESLHVVAAEGLVDLVAPQVLGVRGWSPEVDGYLTRAIELAEKRGALRTAARARLQRAAMMAQNDHPAEALEAAKGALAYFQTNRYRLYELSALQVLSLAHAELAQYTEARSFAERALQIATELEDEFEMAQALENLGGQSNALGKLPEALGYRLRGLEIHRRQKDVGRIGFDLVNTADLLIRLGRHAEALPLLDEVGQGAAAGIDAYKPRVRRAALMRVISATVQHRADEVARLGSLVPPPASGKPDWTLELTGALLRYASQTRAPVFSEASLGSVSSPVTGELRYWDLMGRLFKGKPADVLPRVAETLVDKSAATSDEFRWRIAAIGAAAARAVQDREREGTLRTEAQAALERLRKEWKSDVASYEGRPDLIELRRKAGLN